MHRLSILIPAFLAACGSVPQATYETTQKDAAYRAAVTTGDFVELDAGHCYYELGGPAHAEAEQALLVLVHGFSVPSYIWDPTFQEAVRRGRPVLRLDLFGRGHSSNPDTNYDPDLYADQIIGLLDHLEYRRPVHLVGLSMGGVVVARAKFTFRRAHPWASASTFRADDFPDPDGPAARTRRWKLSPAPAAALTSFA